MCPTGRPEYDPAGGVMPGPDHVVTAFLRRAARSRLALMLAPVMFMRHWSILLLTPRRCWAWRRVKRPRAVARAISDVTRSAPASQLASSSWAEFQLRHPVVASRAGIGGCRRRPWESSCVRSLFWAGLGVGVVVDHYAAAAFEYGRSGERLGLEGEEAVCGAAGGDEFAEPHDGDTEIPCEPVWIHAVVWSESEFAPDLCGERVGLGFEASLRRHCLLLGPEPFIGDLDDFVEGGGCF